jgi:hypothetical protein
MLLPTLAVVVALVVQDQSPLRSAPHDSALRETSLAQGDWLEVRGERQGYLQVYDHRLERAGYVRPAVVRRYAVEASSSPELGAVVDYLRDAPGQESLGIGYVALYLRASPAQGVGARVFDALGTMAERLATRASARVATAGEASLAAQIEVAESYGVGFVRFEQEGSTRVCYDGEAFRRVLALGGAGPERVRAALGLTDPGCVDPALGPTEALALAKWRAGVLDGVDPTTPGCGGRSCSPSSHTSPRAPAISPSRDGRVKRRGASSCSPTAPFSRTKIGSPTKRPPCTLPARGGRTNRSPAALPRTWTSILRRAHRARRAFA